MGGDAEEEEEEGWPTCVCTSAEKEEPFGGAICSNKRVLRQYKEKEGRSLCICLAFQQRFSYK